jgi:chromosome segregation ATPase
MKKISLLLSVATLAFLSSCTDTKQITDLQDQARRLEAQVQKERQENAELSSYRFSMESQFKRKNEDYVKCQEDGKDNFELNTDYDKLQAAYKSLNDANDASREASTRVIVDLEERIKQMRVVGDAGAVVAVSGTSNPTYTSGPTYAPNGTVIKAKRKKRRR